MKIKEVTPPCGPLPEETRCKCVRHAESNPPLILPLPLPFSWLPPLDKYKVTDRCVRLSHSFHGFPRPQIFRWCKAIKCSALSPPTDGSCSA
ncbi:hypothetical protein HYQ46_009232 [Verticillium longisporum]|nr:hypothetical protein HYQ46_009232 [Verticillium longisporum]